MANKRMFSHDITSSDAFLDMPSSTQALYFHLGMEADDDGFIGNPKKVMRVIGVSDDDLKILLTKKFLIAFESGVIVIKHHRINNNWDKYNCKRTTYLEEFSQLNIKENRAYTLDKSQGIPLQTANRLQTVSRIEENRIDKETFALQKSSLQEIRIEEIPKEEVKDKKNPANKQALALREWAYQQLTKEHGHRPTTNTGDYMQIAKALKKGLAEADIKLMVEDALAAGKGQTVRSIFTDREIDLYAQENL